MAAGVNVAADIGAFVQTIWTEALLTAREQSILPALVRNFNDRSGTATRSRADYGTVTYAQVSDADDLVSQTFSPTAGQSLTPYEYGGRFDLTDLRIETDPFGVRDDAQRELGGGAATKVQVDIATQFSSLTGGTVGSAGGTLTWGNVFAAIAKLRQQMAPLPYYLCLNPGHVFHLGTVPAVAGAQNAGGPDFQNEWMRNFFVATVGGAQMFQCNDIATGTAAVGALFSRDAIGYDLRRAFRIEPQRDASKRSWELNASMVYATGIWRPKFGIQIIGTSVVPTT